MEVAGSNPVVRSQVTELDGTRSAQGRETCQGHGGVAERRGTGLQSRLRGFESRPHLAYKDLHPRFWAIGAAVARFPDTEEVTGSNPVSPTISKPLVFTGGFCVAQKFALSTAHRLPQSVFSDL